LSSALFDEAVWRLNAAYKSSAWLVGLLMFSPVVVSFAIGEENPLELLKKYFSFIGFCYFAIFQVLLHGDLE